MEIAILTLGAYQTNTYLVWSEGSQTCAVIDPGYEPETILAQVQKLGKTVEAVLLTHGHFDHVGGVRGIVEKTHCPVYMHPLERTLPGAITGGALFPTNDYGEETQVAGLTFKILHTPGHTPGSVCLLCGNVMFSGDTLFAGSRGRTDFPGGSEEEMNDALQKLARLPGDYQVFPGHGEDTTLQYERKYNYYMKGNL